MPASYMLSTPPIFITNFLFSIKTFQEAALPQGSGLRPVSSLYEQFLYLSAFYSEQLLKIYTVKNKLKIENLWF